jgi:diguanylate cyclase (GGDEF)-like protein/PAS domain S-box-containing protein
MSASYGQPGEVGGAHASASSSHNDLLRAVAACVPDILRAPSVFAALTQHLPAIAPLAHFDRLILLELVHEKIIAPPKVPFAWQAAGIPGRVNPTTVTSAPPEELMDAWLRPLQTGQAVVAFRRTSKGILHDLFVAMGAQSALAVPIFVKGTYWGNLAFDNCRSEQEWTQPEIDILKIFADMVGAAVTRERYVEDLDKANMIVQNSRTILYRLRGDPAFPMIYVSPNIALLGYDRAELLGLPTAYQQYIHPEDRLAVAATLTELLKKDAPPATIEYRMLSATGEVHWMENRYSPVRDASDRLVEVEGIMIDVTERKVADERIAILARTDALTGLANRATFTDRLKESYIAARRGGSPFAILYLDLDRFKEVNDTRGHPIGDQLLRAVAERLRAITRRHDWVARLGGDEFAILQCDVVDPAASGTLALNLIDKLSEPYHIGEFELHIGATIGISVFSRDTEGPDLMLVQADQALYRAKEEGRGRFRFYSDDLHTEARAQLALTEELRVAISQNQLELFYQPQVDFASERIIGMEVQVRWNHPTRGWLLPEHFLGVAEKAGMIRALGRWILDGACCQLAKWRAQQMNVPVIAVSVTLTQLRMAGEFVRDVQDCVARWQLEARDLQIDVTEMMLARTTLAQNTVLEQLQSLGVCIAIADFGTQYSSLDYLRTYHIGRLKIASSMVAAASSNEEGAAIFRAIVSLASELGIEVVAEGVQTEQERAVLTRISSRAKGHGFGQPRSAEDTTRTLRALFASSKTV